jgi:1-acyl-sn-glycerol-3-phosphate acyltransferase
VWVSGLARTRARLAEGPVVIASTHVAWWDGLVMTLVDEALGAEGHVVLESATLDRLPFLRKIGAIGLDRGGLAARPGLRSAAATLDRPGRTAWIFPQGRQRPPWLRPLGVLPGVGMLARMARAPIVPAALTYAFREDARPAALLHLGEPVEAPALEAALIDGLAQVDTFLESAGPGGVAGGRAPPPQEFEPLLPVKSHRVDHGLGARLLAWWGR